MFAVGRATAWLGGIGPNQQGRSGTGGTPGVPEGELPEAAGEEPGPGPDLTVGPFPGWGGERVRGIQGTAEMNIDGQDGQDAVAMSGAS